MHTIGIYKITSPTNRIYIGQSTNIEGRFACYKRFKCEGQRRVYNSLKKYGIDNHKFEIIEECTIGELNEKERYYQDFYSSNNANGMNIRLTTCETKSGKLHKSTIEKIRKSHLGTNYRVGYSHSELTKSRISKANKGKKRSKECRYKMSLAAKGRLLSDKAIAARIKATKGVKQSKEHIEKRITTAIKSGIYNWSDARRKKLSDSKKAVPIWNKGLKCPGISNSKKGINNPMAKQVTDLITGDTFSTVTEACNFYNIKHLTLWRQLKGISKDTYFLSLS